MAHERGVGSETRPRRALCEACGAAVPAWTLFFIAAPAKPDEPNAQFRVCTPCYRRAELIVGNDWRDGWTIACLLQRRVDVRRLWLERTAA